MCEPDLEYVVEGDVVIAIRRVDEEYKFVFIKNNYFLDMFGL